MQILKKITLKNLKLNKKRTIGTTIGIILSVALICAVAGMVTSFRETLIQSCIQDRGYYHAELYNLEEKDLKDLENNRDIKKINRVDDVGYAEIKESQNEYKPYMHIYSAYEENFENLSLKLIKGRMAKNSSEIVISQSVITNGKVDLEVGDKISLDIGQRQTVDGYNLGKGNPYTPQEEKIVNTKKYEFTIVGIIERPSYEFEGYSEAGYTALTNNLELNDGSSISAYITLKNPYNYEKSLCEMLQINELEDIYSENNTPKYDCELNEELLRWEVFKFSDSTIEMLYSVAGVVIVIILVTSIFCIRNAFAISITEKRRLYGMLASIGATKKQIKKNVILEGMILGAIGIPIGILSGIFADFVLIKIVNFLIGDYLLEDMDGIVFKITMMPIILSIVLGIITIYLSAITSARKASKVSPLELVRNSADIKIKNKKLKSPKIIKKIFKTGGVIAYKNLKRSKKKYRTTVISLVVSVFVFITMNSFIQYGFNTADIYYKDYDYNIQIYGEVNELESIIKLDGVKDYTITYSAKESIEITDLSKLSDFGKESLKDANWVVDSKTGEEHYEDATEKSLQILILDSDSFRDYAKKSGISYEQSKDKGILMDYYLYWTNDEKVSTERIYNFKLGDKISGKIDEKEYNIEIAGITKEEPRGNENVWYDGGILILNYDTYKDMISESSGTLVINADKPLELQEKIDKLNLGVHINNIAEEVKAQKSMVLVISIFLYGFIVVITLIGVTNIFNTITSNMELRQKEFAMLKSVGMTKKEFNRMVNLETIFYSCKALFFGVILGILGSFAMFKAFAVKVDDGFKLPITAILISIISVFVLVFAIMRYSIKKINKQNIIETIRKDNI